MTPSKCVTETSCKSRRTWIRSFFAIIGIVIAAFVFMASLSLNRSSRAWERASDVDGVLKSHIKRQDEYESWMKASVVELKADVKKVLQNGKKSNGA